MSAISLLFEHAQFSEAAYANFSGIAGLGDTQPFQDRLAASGFSNSQAAAFVTQWEVIDHVPDTLGGFSATLFKPKGSASIDILR